MSLSSYPPSQVGIGKDLPVVDVQKKETIGSQEENFAYWSPRPSQSLDGSAASAKVEHEPPEMMLAALEPVRSRRPYSAFSKSTKLLIVVLGDIVAVFSPISSNILVPVIPTLSGAFKHNHAVFLWIHIGFFGRRPLYIATLAIYLSANIGLVLMTTIAYWLLIALRALHSTGGGREEDMLLHSNWERCADRHSAQLEEYLLVFDDCYVSDIGTIDLVSIGQLYEIQLALGSFFPETLRSLVGNGSLPPPALSTSAKTGGEKVGRK
ncbi:hypothetical protein L204_104907 [Cryptococcus depauperatus]